MNMFNMWQWFLVSKTIAARTSCKTDFIFKSKAIKKSQLSCWRLSCYNMLICIIINPFRNQWWYGSAREDTTDRWWKLIWVTSICASQLGLTALNLGLPAPARGATVSWCWSLASWPSLPVCRTSWISFIDPALLATCFTPVGCGICSVVCLKLNI